MTVADSDKNRYAALDLWMALLAGDPVWIDTDGDPSARDRMAAVLSLLAATFVVALVWATLFTRVGTINPSHITNTDRRFLGVGIATTAAVTLLAVHPFRIAVGQPTLPAKFWLRLTWRTVAFLAMIVGVATSLPRLRSLGAWPVGILGGADAALTIWALGIPQRPRTWLKRFLISPLHFGVLGGLLGSFVVVESSSKTGTLLGLYAAMWTGLVAAALTLQFLDSLSAQLESRREADRLHMVASERAHRAHWIHDDVLSEVQVASLRIASGTSTPSEILNELRELDHRLRLRQLDETFSGGEVHIYDILQPHLRRAQALKVNLLHVPSHEITKRCISEPDGRLLGRAIAVLTSNAINAGATQLSVDLIPVEGTSRVVLRVTDNAGGFDIRSIPEGRGLSSLIHDLGPGNLDRGDSQDGSIISVFLSAAPVVQANTSAS